VLALFVFRAAVGVLIALVNAGLTHVLGGECHAKVPRAGRRPRLRHDRRRNTNVIDEGTRWLQTALQPDAPKRVSTTKHSPGGEAALVPGYPAADQACDLSGGREHRQMPDGRDRDEFGVQGRG
jgi:hypothetical protein